MPDLQVSRSSFHESAPTAKLPESCRLVPGGHLRDAVARADQQVPLVDLLVADGEHGVQLPGGICLERPRSLRGRSA
ncbi:hypothetical protein ABT150_30425 [Streptomyces mirabilis]|uniref:hypothetical protein n=1 Tax=Streptomyces mirabilis TaxID=68239 RepID=UPI00332DA703